MRETQSTEGELAPASAYERQARLDGAVAERTSIVAWLRKIGQPPMTEAECERHFRIYQRHPPQDPCRAIADAIERGIHAE